MIASLFSSFWHTNWVRAPTEMNSEVEKHLLTTVDIALLTQIIHPYVICFTTIPHRQLDSSSFSIVEVASSNDVVLACSTQARSIILLPHSVSDDRKQKQTPRIRLTHGLYCPFWFSWTPPSSLCFSVTPLSLSFSYTAASPYLRSRPGRPYPEPLSSGSGRAVRTGLDS